MKEITLTSANFESEIGGATPIFVDFWAEWCGPCRMMGGIIEELASESDGSYKVGKVNVDDERAVAMRYGITNIPTIILFKNGEAVAKSVGVKNKKALLNMLQ